MFKKTNMLRSVTILAITLMMLCVCQTRTAKALPANSMWTEPANVALDPATTPVGFRFNVTVYANLSVASYTWQIYLTYNKNHLNATGCWYSAGAKSQWAGPRPTAPQVPVLNGTHSATHNYVLFGESLIGVAETPPGSYSLCIVEFEVVAVPPPGQTYQSQIRLDIEGIFDSYILDTDLNEIPLTFAGTTYVIDEFNLVMLVLALMIPTAFVVLLKNKWLKTKKLQVHQLA